MMAQEIEIRFKHFAVDRVVKDPDTHYRDRWEVNAYGVALVSWTPPEVVEIERKEFSFAVTTEQAIALYKALKHALQLSGSLSETSF